MLKRKIEGDIKKWILNSEKALLIYGARQVGKTFIIRECLRESNRDFVEFNLQEIPQIVDILKSSNNIDELILKLSLYSDKPIIPNETIIFLDEIQLYKEVVTKIKFFSEKKEFRFILSGSLLGVEITNIKSAPVGYVTSFTMYPLDFEEFLQIFNVDEKIISSLKYSFDNLVPVDNIIHNRMLDLFRLYLIIGGMPSAVNKYKETSDINAVISEHLDIINQYRINFTRYEVENKKLQIIKVYDLIPAELNNKNRRFQVSSIDKNLRYERIEDTFLWLNKAGVAIPTYNITEPSVPLVINMKHSLLKLFLSDIGLLTTLYGKSTKLKIINNEKDINKGAIYENVVAQELYTHGFSLYYYNSHKQGEIDFVVEFNGATLPIEAKSGKDYNRHSALNNVLSIKDYNIHNSFVLCNDNISIVNSISYLPIYMIMFIKNNDIEFSDISIDKFKF